jgi:sigma-E factor negative regulatory protein RseA
MNESKTVLEQISALADGEVSGDEFTAVVSRLVVEKDLRATWQRYHLLGDVLRAGAHTPCSDSTRFLARLKQSLSQKAVFLAEPAPLPLAVPIQTQMQPLIPIGIDAANEPVFRWKLVAGAASLAAAAAIGWNWVGANTAPPGAQLAQQQSPNAPVVAVVSTTPVPQSSPSALSATRVMVGIGAPEVMLRDPRLDELLEAHRQAGGASQMPSGFLRNATFAAPSR